MRFEIHGNQPHLSHNTYGSYDLLKGEYWRCFRLPGDKWLWAFWSGGKPFHMDNRN